MKLPEYPQPADQHALNDVLSGDYTKHYTIKEGDVVLDLGGHVGFFSEWVIPQIGAKGKVFLFEAHPRNFREASLRLSGFSNCTLIKDAALDVNGTIDLWHCSNSSGGHSIVKDFGPNYDFSIPIHSTSIGWFCTSNQLRPNFVKIDTEGSENRILSSLFEYRVFPTAVVIECHGDNYKNHCAELLQANQYKVHEHGWLVYGNKSK